MALQNPSSEPSMEEILASIRRIISEDEQGGKPGDPPLDLTQPVEPPPMAAAAAAAPIPAPPPPRAQPEVVDDLMVFDDEPEPPAPVRAAAPSGAPSARSFGRDIASPAAAQTSDDDKLLSDQAYSAAAGAFTRLASSMQISTAHGQTLEGVVRELLRPMLKEWLDANLPKMVEARVEAEVQRIARGGR